MSEYKAVAFYVKPKVELVMLSDFVSNCCRDYNRCLQRRDSVKHGTRTFRSTGDENTGKVRDTEETEQPNAIETESVFKRGMLQDLERRSGRPLVEILSWSAHEAFSRIDEIGCNEMRK
ncbi:hypothetical protein RRG08_035205 [Elysia crispata]|uniref:Uncharacterized protein n=1 Tax=Elysia crispata TaxID=231223 RepID=A0AAE0ZMI2_9GAST|nr:hypothetical protein RRG08_035205 [Elysia crispata]